MIDAAGKRKRRVKRRGNLPQYRREHMVTYEKPAMTGELLKEVRIYNRPSSDILMINLALRKKIQMFKRKKEIGS